MDAEQVRRRRLAEDAAAAAILVGCDPDELRAALVAAIDAAIEHNSRRPSQRVA